MALARRRPLAMRLGRARRRAEARRATAQPGIAPPDPIDAAGGHGLTSGPTTGPTSVSTGISEAVAERVPAQAERSAVAAPESSLGNADAPAPVANPLLPVAPVPLGDTPPPDDRVPGGRLRRCAFRRLDIVPGSRQGGAATYAVMCLYLDAEDPTALGDLLSAQHACGACTFPRIFRPDEA